MRSIRELTWFITPIRFKSELVSVKTQSIRFIAIVSPNFPVTKPNQANHRAACKGARVSNSTMCICWWPRELDIIIFLL